MKVAGEAIINYLDDEGYLRTPLEQIQQESKIPLAIEDLKNELDDYNNAGGGIDAHGNEI